MNAAINSPMKYMVSVHGSLAKTTFRVPPDVVLAFMTSRNLNSLSSV